MDSTTLYHRLENEARQATRDAEPGHDFLHVQRVARNAQIIARAENAGEQTAVCAALLHELVNLPKSHPESPRSGELCAVRAKEVLRKTSDMSDTQIEAICYAIQVHPFSLGVTPTTLEAMVLQDADRLDALGAVGIARLFSTGATLGRPFYAPNDPFCQVRTPDDKVWTLDHVYRKLLRVPETLHTPTARCIARDRTAFLETFLKQLEREIVPDCTGPSEPV